MTTKIKNLQNKINDKTLTIEEREDHFLDLQIEEILENEIWKKFNSVYQSIQSQIFNSIYQSIQKN